MQCPFCHGETHVIDTRSCEPHRIRRRRSCLTCHKRFTTYEDMDLHLPKIIKSNQKRVNYDALKLRRGIELACEKRPVEAQTIDNIINRIEIRLQTFGEREISSQVLGKWVLEELFHIDAVAYIRFASVYENFLDINAFKQAVDQLLSQKKP